jgi:hypothetical protein
MEDFKNLITEPTFTIEKKNIDAGTYKNYVNALLLTNNPDILDIDDRDRRFAMFESSASKKDDEEYFRTLYACIKKKKNAGLFIKYLREEVDASWTPMEFQKYRPITKTYRKQQSVNAKNYIKFISHITSDEGINCNYINEKWYKYSGKILCVVPQKTLYQAYKEMCETYKYVAYPYDKFIYNITQDETGISQCTRHKTKSLKMIKEDIEKWVEIFRNSKDEPIEEFDFDLEEV